MRRDDSGHLLRSHILVLLGLFFILSNVAMSQKAPPACSLLMQGVAEGRYPVTVVSDVSTSVACFWEISLQTQPQLLHDRLRAQAAAEEGSSTTQLGAPTGTNGTTSAISKGNSPLASLASEYGGITSSTSNQTMTVQGTLDGVPSALGEKGFLPYCRNAFLTIPHCIRASTLEWLNRVGLGVTANTSSSSQNVSGTASQSQGTSQKAALKTAGSTAPSLASAFGKFTIWRGAYTLPKTSPKQQDQIRKDHQGQDQQEEGGPPGQNVSRAELELDRALSTGLPPEILQRYQDWQKNCIENNSSFTQSALRDTKKYGELVAKYYSQVIRIFFYGSTADCSPSAPVLTASDVAVPATLTAWQENIVHSVDDYMASMSTFDAQLDRMLRAAATPVLSFEYDFNTPTNQPTTSTFKLIGSKAFGPKICAKTPKDKKRADDNNTVAVNRFTETLNIGGNIYNSTPSSVPGAGRFRGLQAGTEMDVAFCTSSVNVMGSFLGNSTLALTYYYQDQTSPSILKVTPGSPLPGISITGLASSTSSVFAAKGPINFVQLRYGLGVGKNVKFPIAVSWSNRTDLITHALWSAQFGVSYDFSSLLGSKDTTE